MFTSTNALPLKAILLAAVALSLGACGGGSSSGGSRASRDRSLICDENCAVAQSCDPEAFEEDEGTVEGCALSCEADLDTFSDACVEASIPFFTCLTESDVCGIPDRCDDEFDAAGRACAGGVFPGPPSVFF